MIDLLFVLLIFAAGVLCGAAAMVMRHRYDLQRISAHLSELERHLGYPSWRQFP